MSGDGVEEVLFVLISCDLGVGTAGGDLIGCIDALLTTVGDAPDIVGNGLSDGEPERDAARGAVCGRLGCEGP